MHVHAWTSLCVCARARARAHTHTYTHTHNTLSYHKPTVFLLAEEGKKEIWRHASAGTIEREVHRFWHSSAVLMQ
jgi:hypothetical protein